MAERPGSAVTAGGPGSAATVGGPGSAVTAGGPGSAATAGGPGSAVTAGGPGSATSAGGPGSTAFAEYVRAHPDVTPEALQWLLRFEDLKARGFDPKKDLVVSLDDIYDTWAGYSRVDPALRLIKSHFKLNVEYTLLTRTVEQTHAVAVQESRDNMRGGHNKQIVKMTMDASSRLCMMAGTAKGAKIREYYVLWEKIVVEYAGAEKLKKMEEEMRRLKEEMEGKLREEAKRKAEHLHEVLLDACQRGEPHVYVASVDDAGTLVKIGRSRRRLFERIHHELRTQYGFPVVQLQAVFPCQDEDKLERALHGHPDIARCRVASFMGSTEVFRLDDALTLSRLCEIAREESAKLRAVPLADAVAEEAARRINDALANPRTDFAQQRKSTGPAVQLYCARTGALLHSFTGRLEAVRFLNAREEIQDGFGPFSESGLKHAGLSQTCYRGRFLVREVRQDLKDAPAPPDEIANVLKGFKVDQSADRLTPVALLHPGGEVVPGTQLLRVVDAFSCALQASKHLNVDVSTTQKVLKGLQAGVKGHAIVRWASLADAQVDDWIRRGHEPPQNARFGKPARPVERLLAGTAQVVQTYASISECQLQMRTSVWNLKLLIESGRADRNGFWYRWAPTEAPSDAAPPAGSLVAREKPGTTGPSSAVARDGGAARNEHAPTRFAQGVEVAPPTLAVAGASGCAGSHDGDAPQSELAPTESAQEVQVAPPAAPVDAETEAEAEAETVAFDPRIASVHAKRRHVVQVFQSAAAAAKAISASPECKVKMSTASTQLSNALKAGFEWCGYVWEPWSAVDGARREDAARRNVHVPDPRLIGQGHLAVCRRSVETNEVQRFTSIVAAERATGTSYYVINKALASHRQQGEWVWFPAGAQVEQVAFDRSECVVHQRAKIRVAATCADGSVREFESLAAAALWANEQPGVLRRHLDNKGYLTRAQGVVKFTQST